MAIRRFKDLEVWRISRELVRGVYRTTQSQPLGGDYAMTNQMRRSAIRVASNIAEGFERGSRKHHIESCCIAKGSAGELRCQVLPSRDIRLIGDEAGSWLLEACDKCSRKLAAYAHLQRISADCPGLKIAARTREPEKVK